MIYNIFCSQGRFCRRR